MSDSQRKDREAASKQEGADREGPVELYVTSQGAWGIKDLKAFGEREDVRRSFKTAKRVVERARKAAAGNPSR